MKLNCLELGTRFSRNRILVAGMLLVAMGATALWFGADVHPHGGNVIGKTTVFALDEDLAAASPVSSAARARAVYDQLPLIFEANYGQSEPLVKFLARGIGYGLFLTSDEAVLELQHPGARNRRFANKSSVLRMKLAGANPYSRTSGLDRLPGKSNYLIGNDPAKWHRNVAQFARVRYSDVYPGIDLVYYGNQGRLEYDFEVAAGTNPEVIGLTFEGADRVRLNSAGDAVLETNGGNVLLNAPRVYQKTGEAKQPVNARFVLRAQNKIGFEIGKYDRTRALVIDPVLSYSTFLGGSGDETSPKIAVDSGNNFYVTGSTTSPNFPTQTPLSSHGATLNGPQDAFVTKFSPSGAAPLLFSTYLGGSGTDSSAGIAVDAGFNMYVAGTTDSPDFPTLNGFQSAPVSAGKHVFVTAIKSDGSGLIYSTYLSGNGTDIATGVAIDNRANAYVSGTTTSTNVSSGFPATAGAFQTSSKTTNQFFFSKVNTIASGTASLVYSTYLGGSSPAGGVTQGGGIAVDSNAKVYLTGGTNFEDMPTLNANQGSLNCLSSCPPPNPSALDAFVAKFDPAAAPGSQELYLTYMGGTGDDIGNGIAVDSAGNAYVTGSTTSIDIAQPIAPSATAFQTANAGGTDAFIAKFGNPATGSTIFPLNYFSYLGGNATDIGVAIAVDSIQNAHVTGSTASTNFHLLNATQGAIGGGTDAFVALIPTTTTGGYSTFLGGTGNDSGTGIAVDANGTTYVAGETDSANFPTVSPFQGAPGGATDAFVTKLGALSNIAVTVAVTPTPSVGVGNQASFAYSIKNNGPDPAAGVTFVDNLPTGNATFTSASASTGASCTGATGTPPTITCAIGSLAVQATATVTVILTPTTAVALGNSAAVTVNGSSTPISASASVPVTDFSVSAAPSTATVTAGAPATYTATVTPIPTFNANVSLSCSSGLPSGTTCQFSTNPVMPTTSPVQTGLVINTTARPTTTALLRPESILPPNTPWNGPLYGTWLPVSVLALLGSGISGRSSFSRSGQRGSKKQKLLGGMLFGVLLALTLWLPACGSSTKTTTTASRGTPAGTYTVTVSATSGTASRTTTVTLVVQ